MSSAAASADSVLGLAALGKTAVALTVVLLVIYGASFLLRRIGAARGTASADLQVVSSVAVGQRERVVVVDVSGTRLVLGVASGQVNTLHSLPVPASDPAAPESEDNRFSARLAGALSGRSRGTGS